MSAARERVAVVTRVLAVVGPAIIDDTLSDTVLRNALAVEHHTLVDLPEVAIVLSIRDVRLLTEWPDGVSAPTTDDVVDLRADIDLTEHDPIDLGERDLTHIEPAPVPPATPSQVDAVRARLHPHSSPVAFEQFLSERLDTVALIGEVGLEPYAGKLERSINELTKRMSIDVVSRDFPATYAAFLVQRSLHHVEDQSFFTRLPQSAFRKAGDVVASFNRAIEALGAPSFDEVSHRDGPDAKIHHVRRMQMHGGVPATVVDDVMAAICESLATGARTPREVAQDWLAGGEPLGMGVGRPVRRLLTCTDHGGRMLSAFVTIIRGHQFGQPDLRCEPLDPTTVERAIAWLDSNPDVSRTSPGGGPRPQLRAPIKRRSGPDLVLPRNIASWYHDGELVGRGSPTRSRIVPLTDPTHSWSLQGRTDTRAPLVTATFSSASTSSVVLIFDEHGRYHHHALPLGGRTATVIAPSRTQITGEVDRVNLVGRWTGYQEIDLRLDGLTHLEVVTPDHLVLRVDVDSDLGTQLIGPQCPGLSGLAGEPVFTEVPRLVFTGFVPPLAEVAVIVSDAEGDCDAFLDESSMVPEHRGMFDLRELIGDDAASNSTIEIQREGYEPESVAVVTVPGLRLAEVEPSDLNSEVRLEIELAPGYVLDPDVVTIGVGESTTTLLVESPDGEAVGLRATVPRRDRTDGATSADDAAGTAVDDTIDSAAHA